MRFRFFIPILAGSFLFLALLSLNSCQSKGEEGDGLQASLPKQVDFNFHIKPILSDRCFACHGPDENARKAKLRLDTEEGAFALLDSSAQAYAIVPGSSKKSLLIQRIKTADPEEVMPPPESNLYLSRYEIDLLERWIDQGAEWKAHWSFIAPQKPDLPTVKKKAWPTNAIDHFTLAQMESKGLKPSQEASKEKLIRRLSFDLRGLPPTLAEIDAFVADESDAAYDKVVDQFLAEEAFGERMAMEWLDIARYADSHGYQDDLERSMWPWRDWVIKSFNKNRPYDEFVTWQLAGDLQPGASYEQKLETGFNRNHKITQEVGVIDEEYRVTYVLDRVNTFSTAFLGLTVECAQCHDHKYDPISQKEYYSLFSFFNNVPEKGRVDYDVEVAAPYLPLPKEKVDTLKTYLENLYEEQKETLRTYVQEQATSSILTKNVVQEATNLSLPKGLVSWYPLDYIENGQTPEVMKGGSATVKNDLISVPGRFSGGIELMGTNYAELEPTARFDFNRPFSLSFWVKSLDGGIKGRILSANDRNLNANFQVEATWQKVLNVIMINPANKTSLNVISKATIPENKWTHVMITHDGGRKAAGIKLYMDGKVLEDNYVLSDNLRGRMPVTDRLFLGAQGDLATDTIDYASVKARPKGFQAGQLDEILFFNRPLSSEEVKKMTAYDPIPILRGKSKKQERDIKRLLYDQLQHKDVAFQALTERLREYKIRKVRMDDIVVKPTMIMADMDSLRPTYILDRGQYDAKGEQVEAGTPAAILDYPSSARPNRAGLTEWLFDAQNPLTARVAVNRYWQLIFGKGIVATPEDFGSQGALPSHPALLDYLAVEFRESGWNLKQLIKSMVLSATYRQSVNTDARLEQLDPDNIFLARGPQLRLPAELIRDHALSISGLLSEKVGGPSVRPYQPAGLWLQVASGNQSLRKYIQDHEEDLYRRSLYTFWKRTLPPPSMTVFDAPSREQCTIQRRATSTPMQALVLLNDPQYTEASRLIATRMLQEGGETATDRIHFAFRLATSRHPKAEELALLNDLLEKEQADFETATTAAKQLTSIGEFPIAEGVDLAELAAYTVVANAILNLTETILKG